MCTSFSFMTVKGEIGSAIKFAQMLQYLLYLTSLRMNSKWSEEDK